MKRELVPAVMPRSWGDLVGAARDVRGAVELLQVDIMDGLFVSQKTWPYPRRDNWMDSAGEDGLPYWQELDYELDLMIAAPEETFAEWASLGPAAIVIHFEAVRDWGKLHSLLDEHQEYMQFGLSFDDETPWDQVSKEMHGFDYVQCMGIDEIGAQGNPFSERVLDNIAAVQETHSGIMVSVDGSVNATTIPVLRDAGVSRFVVGSAVFGNSNPRSAIEQLESLLQ